MGATSTTPVVAEVSAPVAESGTTTSEFQVGIGTAVADLVALAVSFGVHLTAVQQTDILSLAGLVSATAIAYIVSRGIRKSGTTA
jgi:hypothetical protein